MNYQDDNWVEAMMKLPPMPVVHKLAVPGIKQGDLLTSNRNGRRCICTHTTAAGYVGIRFSDEDSPTTYKRCWVEKNYSVVK